MVGTLLKSKKVTKPKISISFGKKKENGGNKPAPVKSVTKKKNIMEGSDDEDDDEEGKMVAIKSFDKRKGAITSEKVQKQQQLTIIPKHLNKVIRRDKEIEFTQADSAGSVQGLSYGLNEVKGTQSIPKKAINKEVQLPVGEESALTIPISAGDIEDAEVEDTEYDDVPVEQFGAALLRGMGWKGDKQKPKTTSVETRQKSAILGIGAKPIDNELVEDLMGKKKVISIPLKKRTS